MQFIIIIDKIVEVYKALETLYDVHYRFWKWKV